MSTTCIGRCPLDRTINIEAYYFSHEPYSESIFGDLCNKESGFAFSSLDGLEMSRLSATPLLLYLALVFFQGLVMIHLTSDSVGFQKVSLA